MRRIVFLALLAAMVAGPATAYPAADQQTPIKIQAASGPQDLKMTGPAAVKTGQPVSIVVSGLPAVDLAKPIGEQTRWIDLIRFDVSAPKDAVVTLDKELSMSVSPWEWRLRITFTPTKAGVYVVVCDWNEAPFGLALHRVDVGGSTPDPTPDPNNPPDPNLKNLRVTYCYEKDSGPIPPGVASALARINKQSIDAGGSAVAAEFEEDTVDGDGQVPDQFKIAKEAAGKAGLPALVVERPDSEPMVVKSPKTEAEVLEAVK